MRKVLIFAHDFPPLSSVGAMRPESWYRYFKEFKLFPIVITRNWDINANEYSTYYSNTKIDNKVINTEHGIVIKTKFRPNLRDRLITKNKFRLMRKFLTLFHEIIKYKSFFADSTKDMYLEANNFLKHNHVDLIIATGEPWICFRYAKLLSEKYKIPWVCDYRDGWNTDVSMNQFSKITKAFLLLTRGRIEKKIVKTAEFISVSDPDILEKNVKFLNFPREKFINPLNGYDEEKISKLTNIKQSSDIFKIGYAGTIYSFQKVELYLSGLMRFITKNNISENELESLFIGLNYKSEQRNRVLNYEPKLSKFIKSTKRISHIETLKMLKKCNLLLVLCDDKHIALPAKIFEYFGLERKIIVVKNDRDVVENFIKKTSSGFLCNDVNDVVKYIQHAFEEFKLNKEVTSTTTNEQIYSRKNQAKLLADRIKDTLND